MTNELRWVGKGRHFHRWDDSWMTLVGPFGIRDPLRWGVPLLGWSHGMVVIIDKLQMIKTMFEFSNNS